MQRNCFIASRSDPSEGSIDERTALICAEGETRDERGAVASVYPGTSLTPVWDSGVDQERDRRTAKAADGHDDDSRWSRPRVSGPRCVSLTTTSAPPQCP